MTVQRRPPSHRLGVRRRVLESIGHAGVGLALWKRELPVELDQVLSDWARGANARFEGVCRPLAIDLEACLDGLSPAHWRSWLLDDIAGLLSDFTRLANVARCKVSFGVVRSDQCRKFHVDKLRIRLISTYLGPGTEWVPEAAVRRAALVQPALCPERANGEIVRDPTAVRHARLGDVLVMKGTLAAAEGLVHRSPPIEAAGLTRIVMVATA